MEGWGAVPGTADVIGDTGTVADCVPAQVGFLYSRVRRWPATRLRRVGVIR